MKGVTAVLKEITNDATAAAALPRLERAAPGSRRRTRRHGNRQITAEEMNWAMEVTKPLLESSLAMAATALKAQQHAARIAEMVNSTGAELR